jgi:hypothetical protein
MSSAFERRLSAVERRVMPSRGKPLVIVVRGGLASGDPMFAGADQRAPGESFSSFRERVVVRAAAEGRPFVVIGGLPIDV